MGTVVLKNIYKFYEKNPTAAVSDFNLTIKDKEFVVFVGPSGCGKSTTLRMIAGLEEISDGDIWIDDKLVDNLEPKDRDIAMVFQDYALYPHMSVYGNMAFGLKLKKIKQDILIVDKPQIKEIKAKIKTLDKVNDKEEIDKLKAQIQSLIDNPSLPSFKLRHYTKQEIDERVRDAAKILEITEYLERKPKALSGGQRQRVAIGRAIVRTPKAFLMDEPLSNLDAKLRNQMRSELILLRKRIQTTFIYVTHDQTEAMTLGDRIVIMKDGFIQQVGTPKEVFNHPKNIFVATFIGTPQMNLFDSVLDKNYSVQLFGKNIKLDEKTLGILKKSNAKPQDIVLGIRPEHIIIDKKGMFEGEVSVSEMMGTEYFVHLLVDGKKMVIKAPILNLDEETINKIETNGKIKFSLDLKSIHLFSKETTETLL